MKTLEYDGGELRIFADYNVVRLEDVQYLAGHAEPRTTGLYDRRQKKVTRNIVERISF